MKHHALAGLTAALAAAGAAAANEVAQPSSVAPADFRYESYYNQPTDTLPALPPNPVEAATSDTSAPAPAPHEPRAFAEAPAAAACQSCPDAPVCCEAGGDCSCSLGDPWTLKSAVDPCGCCPIDFGGWTQFGFHTDNERLSRVDNDGLAFNDNDDRLNLHQQWLWMEKAAEAPCSGVDWGFRADLMYGFDARKTQAFGNPGGSWDFQNGWDRGGGYGWAMPQLYGELAWGDWSVIAGHFFTPIGYEVVTAPGNFFYSHALTMFNSEPFTHTGVLATYSGVENLEILGGWTAGWDTGFDTYGDGSTFLGGVKSTLSDDVSLAYLMTAGDFGARSRGFAGEGAPSGDGFSHSLVLDTALTDDLKYVFQSDYVGIDSVGGAIAANDQVGINQYLFYTLNDCWAAGARLEWWKSDGFSYQEMTYGLNYRPHANVVLRPEVRYDWTASDAAAANVNYGSADEYNNWSFGLDCIVTF